jgi:anti-sigma-K factor RskA
MSAPDETDLRAAEYVLGTLSADERAAYRHERAASPALRAAERAWEARLAPLSDAVPAVVPPPGAWEGIAARLPSAAPRSGAGAAPPWRRARSPRASACSSRSSASCPRSSDPRPTRRSTSRW